jgi:phosphoglycerate dehydrogenase-like enzyme
VIFHVLSEDTLASFFKDRKESITVVKAGLRGTISEEEVCDAVKDATIIAFIAGAPTLSRKILEAAKELRFIQSIGSGYDSVNLEDADELGIPVANNPGWNTSSVAEHTLMLILMTLKKALQGHRKIHEGWSRAEGLRLRDRTLELKGRTLGIIGLGAIGSEVARLAKAFGPKILYYKRTRLSEEAEKELCVEYRSFDGVLAESDIVSIHTPLTDETKGMIGEREIALMRDGAILINTARAGILDDGAVAEALKTGKLSAAGIDDLETRVVEGVRFGDSPLLDCDNVVFTIHQAGTTLEARARGKKQWVENVNRFLDGEKPYYLINKVWPPPQTG